MKKKLQSLEDFKKLSKVNLIDELMKTTLKGGCCSDGSNVEQSYEEGADKTIDLPTDIVIDYDDE